MQSRLILQKAEKLKADSSGDAKENAVLAEKPIAVAMEKESLRGRKTLDSGEYTVRANALVKARHLVGGVEIEKLM